MGCSAGPNIVEDGLVLALDAGNSQKSYKTDNNLLDPSTWYVGANSTSGVTGFSFNETDSGENTLISDTDPFGNTAVIWKAQSPDGNADGGWKTSVVSVDHTKTYRFSVWVNRKVTGSDGRFYLGTRGYNSSNGNVGVLYRVTGTNNTNPYFVVSGNGADSAATVPEDEWVLVVGHVWPSGSGTGSNKDDTGVWKTDGTKLTGTDTFYDFVWNTTVAKTVHRTYLFYSENDASVIQHWVYPRIDLVDGTEPSIDDLINNRVNSLYVYDMSGQNNHGTLLNGVSHTSGVDGYFDFDGTNDDVIDTGTSFLKTNDNVTLEAFFNHDSNSGSYFFLYEGESDGFGGAIEFHLYANSGYLSSWFTTSSGDFALGGSGVSASAITAGEWNHAAVTYSNLSTASGASSKLYLNGVEVDSGSGATLDLASMPTSSLLIGRPYITSLGRRYNGQVAAVKVYNKALSASEIKQNFNALRGRFGI
jgi:hypothetical protein